MTRSPWIPLIYLVCALSLGYGQAKVPVQPRLTITATVPQAPTLDQPAENASGLPTNPVLKWKASAGAASYGLQISRSSTFSGVVYAKAGITTTSHQVSGLAARTTYYWRVAATNAAGSSVWSAYRRFATTSEVPEPPAIPTLSAPSEGTMVQGTKVTLRWNASAGASHYGVQVSLGAAFSTIVHRRVGITGTTDEVTGLLPGAKYYWRVAAFNSTGTKGYTAHRGFGTVSIPCPGTPTVQYEGGLYHTVLIGSQCWMRENLNVGEMLEATTSDWNPFVINKYCPDNQLSNCSSYGGLYDWSEAMRFGDSPGARGICPSGWHIPDTSEFRALIATVDGDGNALKRWDQGTGSGRGTNTSGFSALLAGFGTQRKSLEGFSTHARLWSSREQPNHSASYLALDSMTGSVQIAVEDRSSKFSVRCIKNK